MARNSAKMSKTVLLFLLCASVLTSNSVICASVKSHFKFLPGKKVLYDWESLTNIDELTSETSEYPVRLRGRVAVSAPWTSANDHILYLKLLSPQLTVASDSEHGHTTSLEHLENVPFVVALKDGGVDKFFVRQSEQVFLKNIKKAIAGLLQLTGRESESHTAGRCQVQTSSTSSSITKRKTNCYYEDPLDVKHSDSILGVNVASTRTTEYTIEETTQLLKSIKSLGLHEIVTNSKRELSSFIDEKQTLDYVESQASNINREEGTLEEVLSRVADANGLQEEFLVTEVTESARQSVEKKSFGKAVEALRKKLKSDSLGTIQSARAFLQLVAEARGAEDKDIIETLNLKKNAKIRPQLYDILGYIQNSDVHKAVFEQLNWDNEEHVDLAERYLWALSFSIHPNEEILVDLLEKLEKSKGMPQKVRDTLILTMASMGRNLRKHGQPNNKDKSKVLLETLEATLINQFDRGTPNERSVYINALKNLRSPSTVPKLMAILREGSLKEEAFAWRALKRFDNSLWTDELLLLAEKTLLQLDKRHDASARTLALDLLLSKSPVGDRTLATLTDFLAGNETNFEVKQYVFQSVRMLAEKCPRFRSKLDAIVKSDKRINNYSGLAPRGLSTVLRRTIFGGPEFNGSLVSFQEISGGIVKRGVVDVVVEKGDAVEELFTLGIFAGGLSGFVSSGAETEDGAVEDETATAGMELTVMDTQIRPFAFFEGNGELMGHVWSGTASDITPAFQAVILVQDHDHYLRLDNGFVVRIDFKGAVSFDLSGKIEISIWSRNAQSLIRKSVGYVSRSIVQLDTPFLRTRIESEASIEPKLNLEIFADFAGDVKLCMVLSQPESIFTCDVSQEVAMPHTKHDVKFTSTKTQRFPGRTYALNRKNGEMCNDVFKD